ncbi:MAG: ribosomal protein L7/L12 [Anaerolineae bacterium]
MSQDASNGSMIACPSCGRPVRATARFCPACGARVAAATAAVPPQTTAPRQMQTSPPATAADATAPPADVALPGSGSGARLYLQAAGPMPVRVLQALRQSLGLGPRDAQAFIAAAPVLLAVDVPPVIAESIRAALSAAGATVVVDAPPPAIPEPEPEPEPEPRRRLAVTSRMWRERALPSGPRTVTGLDVGGTCSRLAYVRAEGLQAITHADLLRFDARTSVPNALRSDAEGRALAYGAAALQAWLADPTSVRWPTATGTGSEGSRPMRLFLEGVARRLSEVLGAAALDVATGATTSLGIPTALDDDAIAALAGAAEGAGFPVQALVPWPLAAITYHTHQGALPPPGGREWLMVVDWGGSALRLAFVERGEASAEPVVIESVDGPPGGLALDALLTEWLLPQLPPGLSDEDRRALDLFVRDYKEQVSRSFAEGKNEHSQYCVVPVGTPPTRIRMSRTQFEGMAAPVLAQLGEALLGACATVGMPPKHVDQVILVGGNGRWYFAREAIRTTLRRVPHIGPRPEEAIARGLAVHGLQR